MVGLPVEGEAGGEGEGFFGVCLEVWAEDVVSEGDEEGEVGEVALADAVGDGSGGRRR